MTATLLGKLEPGEVRGFVPDQIRAMVEDAGFTIRRLGGIGSLGALLGKDWVRELDARALAELVDKAEKFDRDILPGGSGTLDDTGLFAIADRS